MTSCNLSCRHRRHAELQTSKHVIRVGPHTPKGVHNYTPSRRNTRITLSGIHDYWVSHLSATMVPRLCLPYLHIRISQDMAFPSSFHWVRLSKKKDCFFEHVED